MYVQHYVVAHLCNHCCHGTATVHSLFIIVIHVSVNNIKMFIFAMEMQQVIFVALSST